MRHLLCAATLSFCILTGLACSKGDAPAPAPSAAAPPTNSAAPPVAAEAPKSEPASDFGIVAESESGFELYGLRGVAFVDAAGFLARLDSPFKQDPAVGKGLEKGTTGKIFGSWPNGAWLVAAEGSGEGPNTWKWVKEQWAQTALLREGETLLDITAWDDDRAIAAIAMPSNDIRTFLVGGKPGAVMPAPYPADKPKAEGEGEPAAAEDDRSCKVKMKPEAPYKLAGLSTGHLFAAGYGCVESGKGDPLVERWEPKKVRGTVEPLPKPEGVTEIGIRGVAARSASEAYVWGAAGTKAYVAKFDGKAWSVEKVPFEGAPTAFAMAEDGTIFVAAPDGLWKRPAGDAAWVQPSLPSPGGTKIVPDAVWAKSPSEVWVTGKAGGKHYLLSPKPEGEAIKLPSRSQMQQSLSTNRRFLATPACTKPYAHLLTVGRSGDKPPTDFTALRETFKGNKEIEGAKFVIENDGANLYIGAQAPSVAVAKKIVEIHRAKNPKVMGNVFCHEPVTIVGGIPME